MKTLANRKPVLINDVAWTPTPDCIVILGFVGLKYMRSRLGYYPSDWYLCEAYNPSVEPWILFAYGGRSTYRITNGSEVYEVVVVNCFGSHCKVPLAPFSVGKYVVKPRAFVNDADHGFPMHPKTLEIIKQKMRDWL